MKYIKKFENIDWDNEWDFEEEIPISNEFKGNEDFYNFLVENNILDKFLLYFNDPKQINWRKRKKFEIDLNNFLNKEYSHKYLINSFFWGDTPDGHHFWTDISFNWKEKTV